MKIDYDKIKICWDSFNAAHQPVLSESKYMQIVKQISSIIDFSNGFYPQILFPKKLISFISSTFESTNKEQWGDLFWKDLCYLAKDLKGYDFDIKDINVPYPYEPRRPKKRTIEKTKEITVEKYNVGRIAILVALFFAVPIIGTIAMGGVDGGIFISLWFLPLFFYVFNKGKLFTPRREKKTIRISKKEFEKLEKEAEKEYSEAMSRYELNMKSFKQNYADYNKAIRERDNQIVERDKFVKQHFDDILIKGLHVFLRGSDYSSIKRLTDPPQRGRSENLLFESLMERLKGKGVKIDIGMYNYAPDIVLFLPNHMLIDIEIDEPYSYNGKKETHYIGCGDEKRNYYFQSKNWFVLRFSEEQIIKHLDICVMIILALALFITRNDPKYLEDILTLCDKYKSKRWSKEEARLMAIKNYRDTY